MWLNIFSLYIELIVCILSVLALTVFLIIIFSPTGINRQGRTALFAMFLSSLCLNVGHFFKIFTILFNENFIRGDLYDSFEKTFLSSQLFRYSVYCHVFGYYLQSTATMFFTLIQFSTIFFYQRKYISFFIFSILLVIMFGVPITITTLMALKETIIWYGNVGFGYVLLFDIINFISMIRLHTLARAKYDQKMQFDLEHRFQLSQIFIWGKCLIPSFMIAKLLRATSVFLILSIIQVAAFTPEVPLKVAFSTFSMSLDLYQILIVVVIVCRHRKIRRILSMNLEKQGAPKNIDGEELPPNETFEEHFARLEIAWNKKPTNNQ